MGISISAIGQWLSQIRGKSLATSVGVILLVGLMGTVIWSATRDPGPARSDEPFFDESSVRRATAFASVVIVERDVPRLERVAAIPSSIILLPGETTIFTAVALDQFGRELGNVPFNWQVVDPEAGTITSGGIFRASFSEGNFRGAVTVVASPPPGLGLGSVRASVNVTIRRAATGNFPAFLQLFPKVAEVEPGRTIQLTALVTDTGGTLVPGAQPVWEMVNDLSGSVTSKGRFTAGETPGSYPRAIQVSIPPTTEGGAEGITSFLDVLIVEARLDASPIILSIVPQAVSVRAGQSVRFTALALDQRDGQRLDLPQLRWRVLDPAIGTLTENGQLQASENPGVYRDAVEVAITLPPSNGGPGQELTARATVAILEEPDTSTTPGTPARIAIFPEQVVLSPGESTRLIIVGLDENGRPLADLDVQWSLNPELGEVTPFVEVKAGKAPGIYPQAIQAVVTVKTDSGVITREVSADLTIRGDLNTVKIEPLTATTTPGGRVQFRAQALDANGVLLPDISFQWKVVDKQAGEIDFDGSLVAGQELGEYPDAIQVIVTQRIREQ